MSVTKPKLGLTLKIFAASVSLVAVVLLGAFVVASAKASRTAEAAIDRQLAAGQEAVQTLLAARARRAAGMLEVITLVPAFREILTRRDIPRASLLDQAQEHAGTLGATYVLIVDRNGVLQARSDRPEAAGDTLRERASFVDFALDEGRTVYSVSTDQTAIYQVAAVPIKEPASGVIYGVLAAALAIDDSVAQAIKRATGSDVVFWDLSQDSTGRYVVEPRAATLAASPEWSDVLADSAMVARLDADTGGGGTRVDVVVGGTHYLGAAAPLRAAHGEIYGGFAVLRSREAELAAFAGLQRTLLLAGLAGLAVSLVASFAVARRIARPVRQLVAATRKAQDGDYTTDIPEGGSDEIGELAGAFRTMLEDLKEKQNLVDYMMAASGAGRTVPLSAMPDLSATAVRSAAGSRVLAPGELFAGRYEVKSVLGVGGMGVVYCARDRELDELVAIKTLKPESLASDDGSALERFKQEIRLARRITHRNVVRTHDLGEVDGLYYITMEFVEGTSLKDLIVKRGRLPVPVTLTVGKQLCRALEVAHEQGIIHRDIKPQNVVIEPSGFLKVMDFGIARLAERKQEGGGKGLTAMGTVIGTPEYMAPEQLMGEEIDARADLYAAGAVLFECVTGETPFTAPTVTALMVKHIEEAPRDPRTVNPDVPEALAQIILRALDKPRETRWQSAAELSAALEAVPA